MHLSLRVTTVVLAVGGLSACASSMDKSAYVEPAHVGSFVTDNAYVAYVERNARRRGISLTWINVPTRRVKGPDTETDTNQ